MSERTNIQQAAEAAIDSDDVKRCPPAELRLERRGDGVVALIPGEEEPVAVKLQWLRPISDRGGWASVVDRQKHERCLIDDWDALEHETRTVAAEDLARRYPIPRITRVVRCLVKLGNRYWQVETDRGVRQFLIKEPHRNISYSADGDHVLIRDVHGNRYEIASLAGLDERSRRQIRIVM